MNIFFKNSIENIAAYIFAAMFFLSCTDNYKRVGEEAIPKIYPQGIAENFVLTYTETKEELETEDTESSKVLAVLTGPVQNDYENLIFSHMTFPKGLQVDFYDEKNQKSVIKADYGIIYSITNVIDLQGNVVVETHDGKKLEAPQLYYDRNNEWIFTQEKFIYTNPEEGTVMNGEGMDLNKGLGLIKAHKVYGLMTINEDEND